MATQQWDEFGKPIDRTHFKGVGGLECANLLCTCGLALWQGPDGRWVCEGCAIEHNRRDFGKRRDGSAYYVKVDPRALVPC